MKRDRVRVTITCRTCGDHFILRGRKSQHGKVDTGFKQCLCDNRENFHIETEDLL